MTDTPPVAQRERHPAALRTVLLVAVCWRFADGALRGALLALGAQTGPVSSFVSWIVLFSLFPVGWLCDRWWSERRAATVGGWLLIASVAAAALGSYSLTVNGSIVLAGLGAVLLRISLPIMVGNAYAADDPRRLPVFIGLEGASSLGILAASLFVKYLGTDSGVWAFAFPALSLAAAVWLLRRLPESVNVSDEVQAPIPRGGDTLRIAAQVSLVAAALTGLFFLVPTSWLTGGLTRILYPGMALVFVLAFFIWASGHFTMPSSRMALRAMAIVVAAGVTFWAMHTTALTSIYVRIEVLSLVNLTSLSRVAAALVLLNVWRRVSRTLVPATATAMGFSFVLMAGAFIVAGIIGRGISVEYSPLLVYALAGAGAVMIAAAALNAATALAPGSTKGRMVAVWFLTPTLANPASYLVDAPDNPAIIAPLIVSAALFIAFLFLPGRDIATGGPGYPGLVTARPGRIRKAALALSGAIAIASAGWLVIGNEEAADARGLNAAVPPPTFRSAAGAFLPDDADLGFAVLDVGSITVGALADDSPMRNRDEGPATTVTLTPFAIGKFEVTVAQFRQCVAEDGCQPGDPRATSGGDDLPVRYVSWNEALQYCQWLEKKLAGMQTGRLSPLLSAGARVTLPSEAEWETAAGNGSATPSPYPWGALLEPTRANYADSGRLGPVRVGEFAAGASAFMVQDLIGNVAEWTRSEYRDYPYRADDGREDTASTSVARVIRGGSFYDGPTLLRKTARRAADPGRAYDFVGFRVAIARVATSANTTSGAAPPASAPPSQRAPAAAK